MKKRNLAILLIIPFLVSLFGIAAINTAFNLVDNDVVRIEWDYRQNELFSLSERHLLTARGILANEAGIGSAGSRLVWTVENADGIEEPHAEIDDSDNLNSYLVPLSTGRVIIRCTTEKGNIAPMQMNALIYSGNAFVINTTTDGSAQNVDPTLYYGAFDRDQATGAKQPAAIPFDVTVSEEGLASTIEWDEARSTSNVSVEMANGVGVIHVMGTLPAGEETSVVLRSRTDPDLESTFSFVVVENGVNVYTYDDLLFCTNRSERGEVMVLRKHFESLANYSGSTASNVALFGTQTENGFNFDSEVYRFETTYNHEFLDQWNRWAAEHDASSASLQVIAGLRVQKDVYGNGYRLNLHNLCYPTVRQNATDTNGKSHEIAVLGQNDLFRGPKSFYTLGDPSVTATLLTTFGQDNVGVYIDGDGITFNDVKVSNGDFGLVMSNLNYTGTVLEVHGDGDTVRNCVLQNGKTILRSFSSDGLTVDNCILSTARNFLLEVGSNNYVKNDPADRTLHDFTTFGGDTVKMTTAGYLKAGAEGDRTLGIFTTGYASFSDVKDDYKNPGGGQAYDPATQKEQMKTALHSLQKGLNCEERLPDGFDGSTSVRDTLFYRSGVAAIGVNTLFNGPFLYNQSPSTIRDALGILGDEFLSTLIPVFPENISGTSLPVSVDLEGDTRFYDYKSLADWDISGLIDQHISDIVASLDVGEYSLSIDDIFPLKEILTNVARAAGLTYTSRATDENGVVTETEYISIPVFFYGGGRNASVVNTESLDEGWVSKEQEVDLLDSYLNFNETVDLSKIDLDRLDGETIKSLINYVKTTLTKTVMIATGFEPFRFVFGSSAEGLFGEDGKPIAPNYRNLIAH